MEKDSLLLGRIKEIHRYKLIISLPHNSIGVCSISGVSEQYSTLLNELVNNDKTVENDLAELNKLFDRGQIVQVKLNKVFKDNKFDVTMLPSSVNSNVNFKRLKEGMKLQVAIKSREDKGYILETGISGLNGFLPFVNTTGTDYPIGKIIEVYPIIPNTSGAKKQTRVMNFTTEMKSFKLTSNENYDFDSILPGMLIKLVLKFSNNGALEGRYNGFPVTVASDHHRLKKDVPLASEYTVCVIASDCSLKQLDCSLMSHLRPPFKGALDLLSIEIGEILSNCAVTAVDKHKMYLSTIEFNSATITVPKNHIEQNLSKEPEQKMVTCRLTDYNLLDNVAIATTLKRLLELSCFTISQLKVGEIVKGVVKNFSKSGFAVRISNQLIGLIPIPHLTDKKVGNPNSVLQPGTEVKCRVFHIDPVENKLLLTTRKSLINSKLPVVTGYSDFKIGMLLDGFVAKILDFGLVVVLFNNIKGWVPISRVPVSKRKSLSISYQVGQPIQVKVVRWEETKMKVELSLMDTQESVEEAPNNKVSVGEIYEATISQIRADGFNVRLFPLNINAFLSFNDLSDSREHRKLFQAFYSICDKTTNKFSVVVINTKNNQLIVSRKNSLISAATSNRLAKNLSDIVVDSQWIGWITKKESYGLHIELPSGIKGLVRNKDISDSRPLQGHIADIFEIGDTVEVRVTEADISQSNRLLFSLKMSDTYRAADHMKIGAIDFLTNHLEERKFLKSTESCKKIHNIEIGDLVNVLITKNFDWGFTLQILSEVNTENPVTGFVRNQLLPEMPLTAGSTNRAIIIDIDLSEQAVEVCMIGSLINAVTNRKNHCTKIEVNQSVFSDVMCFNNDFVVAMMKNHAHGNLIYIPTKRFWNDMAKEFLWVIKQHNKTVIKSVLPNDVFIGSLAINEAINQNQVAPVKKEGPFKSLPKKIKIAQGEEYSIYFNSMNKNKIFFNVSKSQRCCCNILEYSNSIEDLQQLINNPPETRTEMGRKIKIFKGIKKDQAISSGHLLGKDKIEVGDQVCCKVVSQFKTVKYRLKLPFEKYGFIDPSYSKTKSLPFQPKISSIIQCKVANIKKEGNKESYFMIISSMSRIENEGKRDNNAVETRETNEDEDIVVDNENSIEQIENELEESQEVMDEDVEMDDEDNEMEVEDREMEENTEIDQNKEEQDQMPTFIRKKSDAVGTDTILSIYKRTYQSDDEEINDNDDESESDSCGPKPAKMAKMKKESNIERELNIRNAERRRETGENIRNPTNESEYELLVFNSPNDANTWIKYMRFVLENEKEVDKVRSIAERAMKSIDVQEIENRFKVIKEYILLEINELEAMKEDDVNYDKQLKLFKKLFERGLTQKVKQFYLFVCEKLIEKKLFDLGEEISKRFIKEFSFDSLPWFQLFLVRFVQKKYIVAKETLINAERALKKQDFRDLTVRVGQTEIEIGDVDRGVNMLVSVVQSKLKDESIKNRVIAIFKKNNLEKHIPQLSASNN